MDRVELIGKNGRRFERKQTYNMADKANQAAEHHESEGNIVVIDGLEYLTTKGYVEAIKQKKLQALLAQGRIVEEKA